jgi:hypothetical protein
MSAENGGPTAAKKVEIVSTKSGRRFQMLWRQVVGHFECLEIVSTNGQGFRMS